MREDGSQTSEIRDRKALGSMSFQIRILKVEIRNSALRSMPLFIRNAE